MVPPPSLEKPVGMITTLLTDHSTAPLNSLAASQLGGPSAGVWYVPHGAYAAQAMKSLGSTKVNAGYPKDHTHTDPFMADVMAKTFTLGLACGTSELGRNTLNTTATMTGTFLGSCIPGDASTPI